MRQAIITVVVLTGLVILGYYGWVFGRYINYNVGYERMVKQTITEVVKKECLK